LIILKSPKNIFPSTLFISFTKKKIIKMLPPEISPSITPLNIKQMLVYNKTYLKAFKVLDLFFPYIILDACHTLYF